jgi:hypothetical protein
MSCGIPGLNTGNFWAVLLICLPRRACKDLKSILPNRKWAKGLKKKQEKMKPALETKLSPLVSKCGLSGHKVLFSASSDFTVKMGNFSSR